MDKKHKDLLLVQRANLVENLNMRSGLFTQLLCRKIIDQRMVRKIKNGNTEDEQAEELLDFLPKSDQGARTFDFFCEALIADSQGNIVKTFLKPEEEKEETGGSGKEAGCQETSEAGSSRREDVDKEGKVSPYQEADVEYSRDGDRATGSSNVMAAVAIREEVQQNLYRRTIEPRSLQHSQSPEAFQNNLENEARFLYQNSLRNPSAISNLLNDQLLSKTEKENQLFMMGIPESSIAQLMDSCYSSSKSQSFVVKDGGSGFHQKSLSSKEFPERTFAQLPHVFSASPRKEIIMSSNGSGCRSDLQSFAEKSVLNEPGRNGTYASRLKHSESESDFTSIRENSMLGRNCENLYENEYKTDQVRLGRGGGGQTLTHSISNPAIQGIYRSPSKFRSESEETFNQFISSSKPLQAQPELIEMPRLIEVNSKDGQGRRMVPFPHHISTFPSSSHPDLQGEEPTKGENYGSPRLTRNDSVDTMHKRPLTESQLNKRPLNENLGVDVKRFREDVDTCNVPSPLRSDRLTTIQVFDQQEQQVLKIPVIDETVRKHSLPRVLVETDSHLEKNQRASLLGAMDDPEIDLTDGPISVSVELSTRQFYLTHYKQAYSMRRIPRGKALIINVNEVVGKSARRGTDIDRDNLHNLLCQMHFDVTVYNDSDGLTAMEMVQKLQDFSQQPGHTNADCTIVCILSHGEEGYIFGADGKKFELDAVFALFDNTCCPSLRGKPKIFIIQACRGGALDRGVQYYPDEHDGADARVRQVPSMSDMLICYPTQNGYYAWRNRDRGSWYVEALVQVFMKYAKCEDICTMLNRVNLLVSKKVSHCPNIDMDQMSQMSEYKSTLRMPHLYFFPGIGGCS